MDWKSMLLNIARDVRFGHHMGTRARRPEFFEKSVASIIDVASVLVAYNIGMDRLGMAYGFIYAGMDAFIVVWLSRPITGIVRRLNPMRRGRGAAEGGGSQQPSPIGRGAEPAGTAEPARERDPAA
jgi:hypothetical protein